MIDANNMETLGRKMLKMYIYYDKSTNPCNTKVIYLISAI